MRCAHCMRGNAEAVDISLRHITNLLRHVRHIHHFNITGGEPSLNVRAIRHILERVRVYGITVNDFYIVTNGSAASRSEEFIEACTALYKYQQEKEQGSGSGHMLEMSDDRFHDIHMIIWEDLSGKRIPMGILRRLNMMDWAGRQKLLTRMIHIPVSYTHLDVYKRQVMYGDAICNVVISGIFCGKRYGRRGAVY